MKNPLLLLQPPVLHQLFKAQLFPKHPKQVPSSSELSTQDVDYKFESTPSSKGSMGSLDFRTESRLENIEKTIKNIENEVRTFSSDLENIPKSQKVIESILTNINKKLLKLQKE